MSALVLKVDVDSSGRAGGEVFKRRLVHGFVLIIMAFVLCVTMCSLVMSLFSCDYIKMEID